MRLMHSEEAVTESLAFMLISTIMTISLAAVMVIGYPVFTNTLSDAHMGNMEEGFYLVAYNANKVVLSESPIQSSELRMYGGTLALRNDGYMNVSYQYWNGTDHASGSQNLTLTALEYGMNDERIAYLLGGVFEKKMGAPSFVQHDPIIYSYHSGGTETLVIPMIQYQSDTGAIAGSGYARLTIASPYYSRTMGTLRYPSSVQATNVDAVRIVVSSEYGDSISKYLQDKCGFHVVSATGNEVTLENSYSPGISLYIPVSLISVTMN